MLKNTLKKMSKKAKLIWGGVIVLVLIGIIGSIGGGADKTVDLTAAPTTAPASASTTPTVTMASAPAPRVSAPAPEPTVAPAVDVEDDAVYAQRIYDAWLTSRGASTSAEVLAQSPGNVQGYLVSAESPVNGTVVFTAQLAKKDVTKDELKQAAMAVLQLVGLDEVGLDRVEIVTADGLVRGVANRDSSPLLKK